MKIEQVQGNWLKHENELIRPEFRNLFIRAEAWPANNNTVHIDKDSLNYNPLNEKISADMTMAGHRFENATKLNHSPNRMRLLWRGIDLDHVFFILKKK